MFQRDRILDLEESRDLGASVHYTWLHRWWQRLVHSLTEFADDGLSFLPSLCMGELQQSAFLVSLVLMPERSLPL